MAKITLHGDRHISATYVSNNFIDYYMTAANGEYVKIYLYLLRCITSANCSFSLSTIADKFEHTEKDVQRALKYWEKMNLLRLEYDTEKKLSSIYFLDSEVPNKSISGTMTHQNSNPLFSQATATQNNNTLHSSNAVAENNNRIQPAIQANATPLQNTVDQNGNNLQPAIQANATPLQNTVDPNGTNLQPAIQANATPLQNAVDPNGTNLQSAIQANATPLQNAVNPNGTNLQPAIQANATPLQNAVKQNQSSDLKPRNYTATELAAFQEKENISELLFVIEHYLKRPLTPTDINTILFWYDELKFPINLIEYLVEYCVGKEHTNMRYIEKVALAWKKENINTVEHAKCASSAFSQIYFTVIRALGITGRNLVPAETALIDKWWKNFGFSSEIIIEACRRTIANIQKPNIEYTDVILENWHKKNVQNISDITKLDAEYKSTKKSIVTNNKAAAPNKFHNFNQRTYDYDKLEKQLLNNNTI